MQGGQRRRVAVQPESHVRDCCARALLRGRSCSPSLAICRFDISSPLSFMNEWNGWVSSSNQQRLGRLHISTPQRVVERRRQDQIAAPCIHIRPNLNQLIHNCHRAPFFVHDRIAQSSHPAGLGARPRGAQQRLDPAVQPPEARPQSHSRKRARWLQRDATQARRRETSAIGPPSRRRLVQVR